MATLTLASGPVHSADGTWQIVLGLQNANGIIGLDMTLRYDSSAIHVRSVATTGIATSMTVLSNESAGVTKVGLFGSTPLAGSGSFLTVTYDAAASVQGVPFTVGAQANEGQISIVRSPALTGGTSGGGGARHPIDF